MLFRSAWEGSPGRSLCLTKSSACRRLWQRHRCSETGKDPEAEALVLSGLSPCLLPHPALPALPMAHPLLSLFLLSGKEKGWNQGSIPPPLSHDMGARLPCTLCFEHMLCHWVEPPHQIGTCGDPKSLQMVTAAMK